MAQHHPDVQYQGHGKGTGGLQRHSVGAEYPYTIIARQSGPEAPLRWHVMDTRTGHESKGFSTHKAAEIEIASLKLRNMMHG